MRRGISKLSAVFVLAAMLALQACSPVGIAQVEAISLMASDKTFVDHLVSYSSGKDCSLVNTEQGREYCVEDEKKIQQNIFCYRNLGGVTCYDRADPYHNGAARVDQNEHNRPN